MYNPIEFRETRPEILQEAMARHPLATLITIGAGGIDASHLPLLHSWTAGGISVLRGHLARVNPQWKNYTHDTEALAIFHGPQHYITPAWYPSKTEHGRVVPTWNYIAVHVRGTLTFRTDADWLLANVQALTEAQEESRESPWRVTDAPRGYIENLAGGIVGVEMTIAHAEGKWKLSQNRSSADRDGVIAGLEGLGSESARHMARIMRGELPV